MPSPSITIIASSDDSITTRMRCSLEASWAVRCSTLRRRPALIRRSARRLRATEAASPPNIATNSAIEPDPQQVRAAAVVVDSALDVSHDARVALPERVDLVGDELALRRAGGRLQCRAEVSADGADRERERLQPVAYAAGLDAADVVRVVGAVSAERRPQLRLGARDPLVDVVAVAHDRGARRRLVDRDAGGREIAPDVLGDEHGARMVALGRQRRVEDPQHEPQRDRADQQDQHDGAVDPGARGPGRRAAHAAPSAAATAASSLSGVNGLPT